jgi:molybdenum cofactor biosynthesis enzyme MoaA
MERPGKIVSIGMMKNHIPIYQEHSFQSIPRNSELGLSIDNHCDAPSRVLVIDWQSNCFVCPCEAWLPISVGPIESFDRLEDIWNSQVAKTLQNDINEKKFTWCAVDRCGVKESSIEHGKFTISINIDESCNLSCPSCRKSQIMISHGEVFDAKLKQIRHLVRLLEKFSDPCHIVMSGNGDPLSSHVMRPLLQEFQPKATQTFRLFTNGLLLKKQLEKSAILPNITQYFISVDAGSPDVYHDVRRPGKWETLMSNLDYLRSTVDRTGAEVLLKFVLQQANWHDIDNFIDLCQRYRFRGVINRLEDWGTWSDFSQQDVIGNTRHPEHTHAILALKKSLSRESTEIMFNSSLRTI